MLLALLCLYLYYCAYLHLLNCVCIINIYNTMNRNRKIQVYLFVLLFIASACSQYSSNLQIPQPEQCTNYYSQNSVIPIQCSIFNNTCTFNFGFNVLIQNSTDKTLFLVCLDLPNYEIFVQSNSTLLFQKVSSLFINSLTLYIGGGYLLVAPKGLYIIANQSIEFHDSFLQSYKVWVYGNQILLDNSTITNESLLQTNCNCAGQKGLCEKWTFKYPYLYEKNITNSIDIFNFSNLTAQLSYNQSPPNSLTIAAESKLEITDKSLLRISIIGLFATEIILNDSSIDTEALGYAASFGPGCGYFDEVLHQLLNCMGTGGSHGGFGGNSSPQNCYLLLSRPPYGSIQFPYAPGSGGGFFIPESKQSSSGGGIINIQCELLILDSAYISSQGKNGIQGGGGGAGGAISVQFLNFTAYNTSISTSGGNGEKSSSGSGGRIRLFNHNWKIQQINSNIMGLKLTANGGLSCPRRLSCGENGSIFTSPCRPGFQLTKISYICKQCDIGFYQLTYGYSSCIPCSMIPQNSHFQPSNSNPIDYDSACSYVCNQGYTNYTSGSCQKPAEHALQLIGGSNMIISVCLVLGAIIAFCLIMLFRKLSQNQQLSLHENSVTDMLIQKRYFKMEDIPFHQLRLYVDGSNSPFDAWRISQAGEQNFYAEVKNPITKINHIIGRAINDINQLSKYSRFQKLLILSLKYLYYPLSRLVLDAMRRKRARAIFDSISTLNKKIPDFQNLGIKFNIKPQLTICSLEVFNYTKSVLDFYIENYYPLFFMLQKAPFGGYSLDFQDPFLRVFINQISERHSCQGKSIQQFLKEVNRFLKNPNQIVRLLNYLWSLKQIFPHLQAYLWQPPDRVLGINKQYSLDKKKPLFLMINSENINNRHFIFSENLPCIHYNDIDCLKHKFIIRKEAVIEEQKGTIWIIQNNYTENTLMAVLGVLSVLTLLLSMASLFLIVYYILMAGRQFLVGIIIYFVLWPLSDFAVVCFNFKTILAKNQYNLANSIFFNLATLLKILILFNCSLIQSVTSQNSIISIMYVWLTMIIMGVLIFINQVMLRAQIIAFK